MGSLNKVMLIGHVGRDPEIRYTQNGNGVANFSVATSEKWNNQSGQPQDKTEWHNVIAWNKQADLVQKYVVKGMQIFIEGKLQTRSWEDQQTGQKNYKTEIVMISCQFIGKKEDNTNYASTTSGQGNTQSTPPVYETPGGNTGSVEYDDIPF